MICEFKEKRCFLLYALLVYALVCVIMVVCFIPSAIATENTQNKEHLILVPYRNAALNNVDPNGVILAEMRYALNLLRNSDVEVSVVPLDASPDNGLFWNMLAHQLNAEIDALFTPSSRLISSENMNSAINTSLDIVLQLAKQPNTHATVVLLQTQAIQPGLRNNDQWDKLVELATDENIHADLILLGVSSSQMPDLSNFAEGLGLSMPDDEQTGLVDLSENVHAGLIPKDDLQSCYSYFLAVYKALLSQNVLMLQPEGDVSKVILPVENVSDIMLALEDIPEHTELYLRDADGNPLEYTLIARDPKGRQMISVDTQGGPLFIQAISISQPEQVDSIEEGANDAAVTNEVNDNTAADSTESDVSPAAAYAVGGDAIFSFNCDEQLAVGILHDGSDLYKNQESTITVRLVNGLLDNVLLTYPVVNMELHDGDSNTWSLTQNSDDARLLTANITFPRAGDYTLQARLTVGDFYVLESEPISISVRNHRPKGSISVEYFLFDDLYGEQQTLSFPVSSLFTDADHDALTYMLLSSQTNEMPALSYTWPALVNLTISGDILQVEPLSAAGGIALLKILAIDESGDEAIARVFAVVRSMYQELRSITMQTPGLPLEPIDKRATIRFAAQPVYSGPEAYREIALQGFLEHAQVYCSLIDIDGNAVDGPLLMDYASDQGLYQADLNMPDKALPLSLALTYKISFDPSAGYQDIVGSTSSSININNSAPQWIAGTEDLGHHEKVGVGSGTEYYELQLDLPSLFSDEDDQQDQMDYLVYTLAVEDEQERVWSLRQIGDNIYVEVAEPAEDTINDTLDTSLDIEGKDQVTVIFQDAGHFSLVLTARDPDGMIATGTLSLEVSSQRARIMLLFGMAAASALLLLIIIRLVIHSLRPSFGPKSLVITFITPSIHIKRIVPLKAWGKKRFPLQWLLFYCGIPPEQVLFDLVDSTMLSPGRDGIIVKHAAKDSVWSRDDEPLPRKFVLHINDNPTTLIQGEISVQIALAGTTRDGVNEG